MNYKPKTSKGRNTNKARKVPDVETLPCGTSTHSLTNRSVQRAGEWWVETYCTGCGETWQALDREARR